jgi:hypothetical protein
VQPHATVDPRIGMFSQHIQVGYQLPETEIIIFIKIHQAHESPWLDVLTSIIFSDFHDSILAGYSLCKTSKTA